MEYLPPFVVHGAHGMDTQEMDRHADDYRTMLEAVRDGTLDLDRARTQSRINADLPTLLLEGARGT